MFCIKGEECEFHVSTISLSGYIINQVGMIMDETKVNAVTEWPAPCKVKELQCFLKFENFYHHFIRGFSSSHSSPEKKGHLLEWSDFFHSTLVRSPGYTLWLSFPESSLPWSKTMTLGIESCWLSGSS